MASALVMEEMASALVVEEMAHSDDEDVTSNMINEECVSLVLQTYPSGQARDKKKIIKLLGPTLEAAIITHCNPVWVDKCNEFHCGNGGTPCHIHRYDSALIGLLCELLFIPIVRTEGTEWNRFADNCREYAPASI